MTELLSSIRIAGRSLYRSRQFAILAVATLALGIGLTTAFFSVFDAILLRPLAYPDSERLVTVLRPGRGPVSPPNFVDLQRQAESFEALTAATPWQPVLRGEGPAQQLEGLQSTPELFDLLGQEALLGRTFSADEESNHVAVLGYDLWRQIFGGDPDILGRGLNLDGRLYTVIGVMPEGFQFPPFWATGARFWVPFDAPNMWHQRDARFLRVFGRLGADLTVAQAQEEVNAVGETLKAEHPEVNSDLGYVVEPMSEPVVEAIRPALRTIFLGVGFVLLIACANVAGLWLTRTADRRRELAVRMALGARGWSLWRQGLAESATLMTAAAALGWLLALWGLEVIQHLAPPDVPRLQEAVLDVRVFGFTLGVSTLMAFAFACLLPSARGMGDALAGGSRRIGHRGESRARSLLVSTEIALALMLLLASGLMAKSLLNLWRLDPGLRTEKVLTVQLPFSGSEVAPEERQNPYFDRLLAGIKALPGVENAALINHLHLGGDIWSGWYEVEGQPVARPSDAPSAVNRVVSEDLFRTFEIPLREGRYFRPSDHADAGPVAIVSRSLAERHWPGESAVGRRFRDFEQEPTWYQIVGVVDDVHEWSLTREPGPTIYFPYRQNPVPWWHQTSLVVTTQGDEEALTAAVAGTLRGMKPELPMSQPRTLQDIYGRLLWQPRFTVALLSLFTLLAICLAAIGVFGAMSNAATSRRRELGVRAALGAERRHLVGLLLRRNLSGTLWGIAAGLAGAGLLGRLLKSQLHGVSPYDLGTVAWTTLGIALVALLAAFLPAVRAGGLDPVVSLRES